ncbi:hypothetical protein [Moorena producens]|uniref:hypothetical protein n=1 Tax=Moorena producens TaxID=1155739 RepID=UPI003C74EA4E
MVGSAYQSYPKLGIFSEALPTLRFILFISNYWSGIDQQRDRIIMIWRRYGVGWAVLIFEMVRV